MQTPLDEMRKQNNNLSKEVEDLKKYMSTLREQNEKMMSTITLIAESQGVVVEQDTDKGDSPKPTLI